MRYKNRKLFPLTKQTERRACYFRLAILLALIFHSLMPSSAKALSTVPNQPHASAPLARGDYFHQQKKIYRWSDQTRFVLVYIATAAFLPDWQPWHVPLIKDAFADWQHAMNNRLMFIFMNEPTQADITVNWWNQAQVGVEAGASGLNRVKTCGRYISENDIYLSLHDNNGKPWSPTEMYPFALHEIGHMIGIQEHSDNPDDILAPVVRPQMHITARDIATLQRIYAARADYTNPPGMHMSQFDAMQRSLYHR